MPIHLGVAGVRSAEGGAGFRSSWSANPWNSNCGWTGRGRHGCGNVELGAGEPLGVEVGVGSEEEAGLDLSHLVRTRLGDEGSDPARTEKLGALSYTA